MEVYIGLSTKNHYNVNLGGFKVKLKKEILTSVFTTTFMDLKILSIVMEKLKHLPNALKLKWGREGSD